jgi:coenzyme F420-reducing hydrogenase alpha subunit
MKIRIDHIAKIEGHASFTADIVKGDVRAAKIKIEEGARLFEGIMRDRKDVEIPELGSRICGVCPVVHNLTGFKALEDAYNIKVEEPAVSLRKAMMMGQLINSHALHLFFFSLSDFFGFKSDLELINEYPEKTHDAMKIRDVGNKLVELIGGRTVHPLTPCIGGIRQACDLKKLKKLFEDCKNTLPLVIKLGELFIGLKYPDFSRQTNYVSLTHSNEYAVYEGKIKAGNRETEPREFLSQIKEFQEQDKVAKRIHWLEKSYMVGALARLHNNQDKLNPEAKKLLEKSSLGFPCYNPFYNILAQAVELVHCFEESIKILGRIINQEIKVGEVNIENRTGQGIGAIEAPRGTLFYDVKIKQEIVENVNIITPTAQNIANLEDDLEEFENIRGFKELNTKQREDKIKMLIRAYDPCVTCSVH